MENVSFLQNIFFDGTLCHLPVSSKEAVVGETIVIKATIQVTLLFYSWDSGVASDDVILAWLVV